MKTRKLENEVENMNKKPLIFTKDKETAKMLMNYGFQLISKDETGYTFLNQPKSEEYLCAFSHGSYTYTNKLFI